MPSIRTTAPAISSAEVMKIKIQDGDGTALADVATDGANNALWVQSANMAIKDSAGHAWNILATGEGDVNLKRVGGNAINVGSGAADTGTIRVIHATDDPLITAVAAYSGTVGDAAPAKVAMMGAKAETTFPAAAVDDGDAVDPLFDEYGRQWVKGYDPSSNSLMVTDIAPASMQKLGPITFTTLTATGSTAATNIKPYSNVCFQVVVASLAAGESCVVRAEGSHDNSSWYNLDDDEVDKTIIANGTYKMDKAECAYNYVRFTFVTDSASGAVTIAAKLIAGLN